MIESVPPVSALSLRTAPSPHLPDDTPGFDRLTSGLSAGLSPGGAEPDPQRLGALFFDFFEPGAQGAGLRHVNRMNRMLSDDLSLGKFLKESLEVETLSAKIVVFAELSKGLKNAINSLIQSA